MFKYFLRRVLLIPITFLVITLMVYTILRIAPGGPIEQLEAQLRGAAGEAGGGSAGGADEAIGLDEGAKEELRRYYNLDRPIPIGYLQWLGVLRKSRERGVRLAERQADPEYWGRADELLSVHRSHKDGLDVALKQNDWVLAGDDFFLPLSPERRAGDEAFFRQADEVLAGGPKRRPELRELLDDKGYRLEGSRYFASAAAEKTPAAATTLESLAARKKERDDSLADLERHLAERDCAVGSSLTIFRQEWRFSGVLQGDFGQSFNFNRPALEVIVSRFPISIFLGLIGYFSSWLICIPLGLVKAITHRSRFDTMSSFLVFLGYSTPGWVACLLLLIYFGGGSYFDLIPLGGFRSPDWNIWWENGEYWRCIVDQSHHMAAPVIGFLIGHFALMTVLMKNSLMENLGADYVRTAFAKGLPERRVILVHTLRNSMIPITAGVGRAIGLVFAGSFLIEKTCNIPGMGLLGYNAILQRDYPIILGTLVFGVLILLIGNIISDLIWAAIDPRIRFR